MSERGADEGESELYDETYYKRGCGPLPYDRSVPHWGQFFGGIADELIRTFRARRVFDAGCAKGFLVEALWDRGVAAFGRDISRYAISEVRPDIRQYCSAGSLADPIEGRYDLVTCIEVVEHMPEDEALTAIAHMCAAADVVVLSSSPSDFDEPTHINVRPPIYWMRAFARHAFAPLIETTLFSITPYALAFRRQDAPPTDEFLAACAEVVRSRMRQAEDAGRIHELSVALTARTAEVSRISQSAENERRRLSADADRERHEANLVIAGLQAEVDRAVTDRDALDLERARLVADRDAAGASLARLTADRDGLASALASATQRARTLENFATDLVQANVALQEIVGEIQHSRALRAARRASAILGRLRAAPKFFRPIDDLIALARTGRLLGFDPQFYLERNRDVADTKSDPFQHYIAHGRAEGRAPSRALEESATQEPPRSSGLLLRDLCDPEREETGPKVSDEAFLVSVLTPMYNIAPRYIRELYRTLANQIYANWEWVVVDDGSTATAAIAVMREISERDPRVRFIASPVNLGIAGASNLALSHTKGSYVALVDHDDLLARRALLAIHEAWKSAPDTQVFYTDEAFLQPDGAVTDLWAKPDWSPAYLECTMCLGHLTLYRRDFLTALGFRSEFDGTQDFDLALRAMLHEPTVVHVPVFAYLWRVIPGSAAAGLDQKSYAVERQRRAVLDYARTRHPGAEVGPVGVHQGFWRIRYPLSSPPPTLSYVIPAGGGKRTVRGGEVITLVVNCVRSFQEATFYPNCEYIVVHDGNLEAEQIESLSRFPGVRFVVHRDPSFNFSRTVNAGVAAARGEYVCLLNDDVEAITPSGGEELVGYMAANPDVGIIGPKCLFENDTIQQCGVVLPPHIGPAHAGTGMPREFGGHRMHLYCRHEVACVGAAMLIARKDVFQQVGGFAEDMPLNYNDVDFSLRVRDLGYRCVVDPGVEVYHYESATKIGTAFAEQERLYLGRADIRDPYFSKWFDPGNPFYQLDLGAPDRPSPFGAWLDRHIARRAADPGRERALEVAVCLLVEDQPLRVLDEAARSFSVQTYGRTQLLLADRGVEDEATRAWFDKQSALGAASLPPTADPARFLEELLERSDGDLFVFLEVRDFLSVDALQLFASVAAHHPEAQVFYSDHYGATVNSTRENPFFKPDFDPILLSNLWYVGPVIAARRDLLARVAATRPQVPMTALPHLLVAQDYLEGRGPHHVRELAYARRARPDEAAREAEALADHRLAMEGIIRARGGEALSLAASGPAGPMRLRAAAPVSGITTLDARALWAEEGSGVARLREAVADPDVSWVAVLLDGDRERVLNGLSAPARFHAGVNAVCGTLLDEAGAFRWSGGVFLPGGRVFDPNLRRTPDASAYPSLAGSQRCIDVPAPLNVLIRADALRRLLGRPDIVDADGLMVALGLDAAERGEVICVNPDVSAVSPRGLPCACADRRRVVLHHPALVHGSRWYDGRLSVERPYRLPGVE